MEQGKRWQLEERKLDAMRNRIVRHSYLSVNEIAAHFCVTRSTIELLPEEILPYVDLSPTGKRQLKRYHPQDVITAEVRLREWRRAQQQGQGEAFLARLREDLARRDEAARDGQAEELGEAA